MEWWERWILLPLAAGIIVLTMYLLGCHLILGTG